ncbi:cytidylyltransferase domain-containing protein [Gallibacterium trehalosifermentans]|uniref:Cytidylyltransferase domain-containing protein n=1 Tax=Gallibacterium trehalosifermentans TaxID=516935 RepID=A0ABV6H0G5_9PAST
MKKIAIITARAGSKGLPQKNVLLAYGKPLVAYTIEAAISSQQFEKIIITTDSQEYIDLLSHYPPPS